MGWGENIVKELEHRLNNLPNTRVSKVLMIEGLLLFSPFITIISMYG